MQKVILLADDSPDDELFFKRTLKAVGVANPLRVVSDGQQAIAYLKGEGVYANRELFPIPTVLFLDLIMPRADGWTVLRWLRANPDKAKMLVIVLTGPTQQHNLQEAYSLGANSFLFKPFQKAELEGLIRYWPDVWISAKLEVKDTTPANPPTPSSHPTEDQLGASV